MLKIGISACFFHADPQRPIFKGMTLQYIEQNVAHWLMQRDVLAFMVPSPDGSTRRPGSRASVDAYADELDGLVLMGGSDVCPATYGESPLKPEWNGDRVRDEYEQALTAAFMAEGKPVFDVCRGLQLLNVAFGGTLYQDIATQRPGAPSHREASLYDRHFHDVAFVPGTRLAELYPGVARAKVNSVHHQAIKDLAPGFVVEARSPDGLVEAMRRPGDSYVAAVQWHPEFHRADLGTLDDRAILQDFLDAAAAATTR
jgi:putative glutamine amidotransferase